MFSKRTILLLIDCELSKAPRAQTMVRALKEEYDITVAAYSMDHESGYHFEELKACDEKKKMFHLSYPVLLRKSISAALLTWNRILYLFPNYYYKKQIWNATNKARLQQFSTRKFDAIICHHAHNLPVAATLARKMDAVLFFNAHEYYPREFDHDPRWVKIAQPFIEHICKKYLKDVKKCFAAAPGYANAYQENFRLDCTIIPCVKPFVLLTPQEVNGRIRIVHQGYANPDRKIENMIEMCEYLDNRFELYLYLLPTDKLYFTQIESLAGAKKNVKLLPPVRPEKLLQTLNQYDIGLYILEPTNFNTKYMLPNKTFEFVQSRLMTAISPALGMIPYVKEYNLGIIAEDHSAKAMAEKLNALKEHDIMKFKRNTDKAAVTLAAEAFYPMIRKEVSKFLE